MGKKKKDKGSDEPKPEKVKKPKGKGGGKKLKKAAVTLLVLGILGGGGYTAYGEHEARKAAELDALPYASATEVAQRAYQSFRAQGVRLYELQCPAVAEKTLGQVTTCSAEDDEGTSIGVTATTVEDAEKRFEFQQA